MTRKLEVWALGVPKETKMMRVMLTDENGFTTEQVEYKVEGGRLEVTLGRTSAAIFCQEDDVQRNYIDKKREGEVSSASIYEHEAGRSGKSILGKVQDRIPW